MRPDSDRRSASQGRSDGGDDQQHEEDEEEHLRDTGSRACDASEAEHARNEGDNEKCESPA